MRKAGQLKCRLPVTKTGARLLQGLSAKGPSDKQVKCVCTHQGLLLMATFP